ncbi:hypothetical protein MLD38_006660 [Melastoma candidum]|uniref:Uncharacterized protein n=1 Tax=Melastoma candidum TaxID=119954 RepID=A0ACB9RNL4_9MYRT|nr:hypothetical protein MLD38_006660 [Melastoma candidum]
MGSLGKWGLISQSTSGRDALEDGGSAVTSGGSAGDGLAGAWFTMMRSGDAGGGRDLPPSGAGMPRKDESAMGRAKEGHRRTWGSAGSCRCRGSPKERLLDLGESEEAGEVVVDELMEGDGSSSLKPGLGQREVGSRTSRMVDSPLLADRF